MYCLVSPKRPIKVGSMQPETLQQSIIVIDSYLARRLNRPATSNSLEIIN